MHLFYLLDNQVLTINNILDYMKRPTGEDSRYSNRSTNFMSMIQSPILFGEAALNKVLAAGFTFEGLLNCNDTTTTRRIMEYADATVKYINSASTHKPRQCVIEQLLNCNAQEFISCLQHPPQPASDRSNGFFGLWSRGETTVSTANRKMQP